MGQSRKKRTGKENLPYAQRLQSEANEIVKFARYIVENNLADWKHLSMPDGSEPVALVFSARYWEMHSSHKLTLKLGEKKDEPDTTNTDERG